MYIDFEIVMLQGGGITVRLFYDSCFIASVIMMFIYIYMYHKHFDVHISLIFAFVPIQLLGYGMMAGAENLHEAYAATKVIYLGACYGPLFFLLVIFEMCHVKIFKFAKISYFILSSFVYLNVLSIGYSDIFYKDVSFEVVNGIGVLTKHEYGPMHVVFYLMIINYLADSIFALVYCYVKKKSVSRKMVYLLLASEIITGFMFFAGKRFIKNFDITPIGYVMCEVLFLILIYRICLYDITDTAMESIIEKGTTGFVSFDFKLNYLGSNETAREVFPEIRELTVDRPASRNETIAKYCLLWIESFNKDKTKDKFHYKKGEKIYLVDVNYLFDGKRKKGYQLVISDDTKDQKYINLLNKFNTSLKEQVSRKTNHIIEMHNNLIMSMAAMVESRDNSTGGHIKRTSECVRILIEEMKKDNEFKLSERFRNNIVKAAPMHDLGKIAVDDRILRKPGRFEPEEFEEMKKHAAEGARIVRNILKSTDDADFRIIAENVAHYHHERWDGSGYPEGLKGEKIPIEARIMAIADVYDALVSKRVYKESMSFEKADAIILEGMGKHFDKRLEKYYVQARPKLEQYYRSFEE